MVMFPSIYSIIVRLKARPPKSIVSIHLCLCCSSLYVVAILTGGRPSPSIPFQVRALVVTICPYLYNEVIANVWCYFHIYVQKYVCVWLKTVTILFFRWQIGVYAQGRTRKAKVKIMSKIKFQKRSLLLQKDKS